MANELYLLLAATIVGLAIYWQFSAIRKRIKHNLSTVATNPVLLGHKGRKQQLALIALLTIMLVGLQISGLLF